MLSDVKDVMHKQTESPFNALVHCFVLCYTSRIIITNPFCNCRRKLDNKKKGVCKIDEPPAVFHF